MGLTLKEIKKDLGKEVYEIVKRYGDKEKYGKEWLSPLYFIYTKIK